MSTGGKGLPPAEAGKRSRQKLVLQVRGPVVQVALHWPAAMAQELLNRGEQLPDPVAGDALIDTGASMSCIDTEAADALGLSAIDVARMHSASHADHEAPVFPVALELLGPGARFDPLRAMGASLKALGLVAVIGRDALANAVVFYIGLSGEITLVLP